MPLAKPTTSKEHALIQLCINTAIASPRPMVPAQHIQRAQLLAFPSQLFTSIPQLNASKLKYGTICNAGASVLETGVIYETGEKRIRPLTKIQLMLQKEKRFVSFNRKIQQTGTHLDLSPRKYTLGQSPWTCSRNNSLERSPGSAPAISIVNW